MLYGIEGKLNRVNIDKTIIENNNVYYEIFTRKKFYETYKEKEGEKVFIYLFKYKRENFDELYGFISEEEREFFITLIGISGIGPKKALEIIDANEIKLYKDSILRGDISPFEKVKGIGKKVAQKILIELAGKIDLKVDQNNFSDKDIFVGLKGLGFNDEEINSVYKKYSKEIERIDSFEEKFKYFLSKLSKI
ncbi:MAG: Holliday junction branch migration protein RuvA [Spirochaetes bacterium]|nr:Holliday junction branch migration protein RuvA [Spirochaetota bacterium]